MFYAQWGIVLLQLLGVLLTLRADINGRERKAPEGFPGVIGTLVIAAPTRAEIGRALDISRPTAEQHLQALRRAGLVTLRTQWRGIFLREPTRAKRPTTGA